MRLICSPAFECGAANDRVPPYWLQGCYRNLLMARLKGPLMKHKILIINVFSASFAILPVAAQTYPDKPIRVIVAVPGGGAPDVLARTLAPGLSNVLGRQIVIDNRAGAGGLIGTTLVARAEPDGYTLFVCSATFTIQPHLRKGSSYDPVKDFAPVVLIANAAQLLVVHPSLPVTSVRELIAYAKARPGKLNYASAGIGSTIHLGTELFNSMAGIKTTHVAYQGAPQARTDLLAGNVDFTINAFRPLQELVKAGRLRALGITSAKRSPLMPEIPTISEAGVAGYEWGSWYGLLAPAKTPRSIVVRLHQASLKVLQSPEVRAQLDAQGNDVVGGGPEEFAAFIGRRFVADGKAVKLSGLTAE